MRLCDLFPQSKLVTLGGREWLVSQFTLRDIGTMESWAASLVYSETDAVRAFMEMEPGTPERRKALRAAYNQAEGGLPGIATEAVSVLLATPTGAAFSLWLSLRKARPDLDMVDVIALASEMSEADWSVFHHVAWARDFQSSIQSEIYDEIGVNPPGIREDGGSWAKSFLYAVRVAKVDIEAFGNLTIGQWNAICRQGEPIDRSVPVPPGWTTERFDEEILKPLKAFWDEGNADGRSKDSVDV